MGIQILGLVLLSSILCPRGARTCQLEGVLLLFLSACSLTFAHFPRLIKFASVEGWWYTPVVPALQRWRQENQELRSDSPTQ